MYQYHNRPPGTDPAYFPPPLTVPYTQNHASYEPQLVAASTAATCYQNPNAVAYYQNPNVSSYYQDPNTVSHYQGTNATWTAAIAQLGAASYAPVVTSIIPAVQSQKRNTSKKGLKAKKAQIVQSAWCEVCKIDCDNKGVLDQHRLGKKHMKNLVKLEAKFTAAPPPTILTPAHVVVPAPLPVVFASGPVNKPIIGPEENPGKQKFSSSRIMRKKAVKRTWRRRKEELLKEELRPGKCVNATYVMSCAIATRCLTFTFGAKNTQ